MSDLINEMYNEEIREAHLADSWEPYVEIKFPGLVMGELDGSEIRGGGMGDTTDEALIKQRIERSGYHPALVRALANPARTRMGSGYRYTIKVPIAAAEDLIEFCECMCIGNRDDGTPSVLRALRLTIMHINAKITQSKEKHARYDERHRA